MRSGYLTPAVSGAQIWAIWLHNACPLGVPWGFLVRVRNQRRDITHAVMDSTCGQIGYITRAVLGVLKAGTKSEMATNEQFSIRCKCE